MANINNTSSYMDETKKQIIKESNYTYRDALEVSAYLIEAGKFERFYKEMQSMTFKRNLRKWETRNRLQKINLTYITLLKETFFHK